MQGISKNFRKFNLFEISVISLFWLLLFASPLLLGQSGGGTDWMHVFKVWKEHSVLFALFLINRFILLPHLFFRNRRALYMVTASFLIALAVAGMFIYYRKPEVRTGRKPTVNSISQDMRGRNREQNPPQPQRQQRRGQGIPAQPEPIPAYINLLILSVLLFGFDTGLKTTSKWVYSEQQRIILEKENIETQLAFLKHQISPHFFMNTLNNIHSLIDVDAEEAKKSVIKLSGLMRHLLYDSDHELSSLKSEVDFIRSYVDLMRLRYSKGVRITLNIPDKIPDKSIPPLLFISLLENAFKHGISYLQDSFIDIELKFTSEKLQLVITNSKSKRNANVSESGIGIGNTRKRLDLLFKGKYTLDVTDRGNTFITNLIIPV
jgi:two-component sensor histidine kinase